jgi:YHS domain-containing protein
MGESLELFGRLHPLVLHLPIGALVALGVLELAQARGWLALPRAALGVLAWLAAGSAVVSAAAGWQLAREPGYGGDELEWHERLGIALAAVTLLAALVHAAQARCAGSRRGLVLYRALLLLALVLLVPAGHLGATLTHGEDWLLEPLRPEEPGPGPRAVSAERSTYELAIAPILEGRCTSCHGSFKWKGGLRLDLPEGILAGGEDGPVIVPGDPGASELVRRISLPAGDEDHMPPAGKKQLAQGERETLVAWIAAGAPVAGRVELAGAGPVAPAVAPEPPAAPDGVPPADPAALAALEQALVHVERVERGSNRLWVDFAAVAAQLDEADVQRLLAPLAEQLSELSLARTACGDPTLAQLARAHHLRQLDLRATTVSGAGLAALAGLAELEELVLAETRLDDGALAALLLLPALRRVTLWEAGLSPTAIARLRAERPGLVVVAGDEALAEELSVEGELAFTSDRPVPGGSPAPGAALEPVNATCPVSGSPVKPEYRIVFRGRVVGFCCPNCPKEFWSEPERFAEKLP